MTASDDIVRIQSHIKNRLSLGGLGSIKVAGVIGDSPSHYSKSPALWNAVFRELQIDAAYFPLDVDEATLPQLVRALRASDRVLGVNVTVPYKVRIMEFLDEIDEQARKIKAVNTVVRTETGQLVGFNTDGKGFLNSLRISLPGRDEPFVTSLPGLNVLILGAGGSARAVAMQLSEMLGNGEIVICNRSFENARALAQEIQRAAGKARAIGEDEIAAWASRVGLIVNCTVKGQGGVRRTSDGRFTILEPYSALAPARPASFDESRYRKPDFYRNWLSASLSDIEANNRASWEIALATPIDVGFYDLVYHPEETVFLRHGQLTGHRTLNGKAMIVGQAAEAFSSRICKRELEVRGMNNRETYQRISEIMFRAW